MDSKEIFITDYDKKRLLILIKSNRDRSRDSYMKELEKELARAKIVTPQEIPGNVVTMNSKIVFEFLDSREEMTCQLVFPEDADFEKGRISILAPIGTALLGYRVGDCIEWEVPSGTTKVKIKKILYQPEAAGDYSL
jgi:regulator of nucleoside diphosphate kinase